MQRNPLKNLLASNKGRGQFRAEVSGDEATVYLYDVIVSDDYWGGVSALAFAKELAGINAEKIHLRLDSPGGDVFASVAMAQAMREHSAKIIVHVDGYAASAATQLLMAADESVISKGGMVMIHKAWTLAIGNTDDLSATAVLLNKIDGQIAESYATKTGMGKDELLALMAAETWMTETEAVDLGFVDAIAEPHPSKKNSAWDLSAYKSPPRAQEPPPGDPPAEQPNSEDDGAEQGAVTVSAVDHLRRKLRITEGAY